MANNPTNYKQVILIREDLNLSAGKLAAQVAHASLGAILSISKIEDKKLTIELDDPTFLWISERFTKICLKVKNEEELLFYYNKVKESNLKHAIIKDAGFTELESPTLTCLGIGPDFNDRIDAITKKLRLYNK